MIALDAGILAVALNRFAPEHARAARVLDALVNGDRPFGVPWPAAHEFLRIVSHPHRVARPLAMADALGFLDLLLASPQARALAPGPGHARAMAEVLGMLPAGTHPPGLAIAAILREHGVREVLSADRGLRAFPFLAVRNPLEGAPWNPEEPPGRRYRRLRGGSGS